MRKTAFVSAILLMIVCAPLTFGQKSDKPDLSGTWELIKSKVASPLFGYEPDKAAEDKNKKIIWRFVIQQSGPVIKVTEIRVIGTDTGAKSETAFPAQTFYTDGRGETNYNKDDISYSSVTKWNGKELYTLLIGKPIEGTKYRESAQTIWRLASNGSELQIIIASSKTQNFFGADQHIINTDPFGRTDIYKRVIK